MAGIAVVVYDGDCAFCTSSARRLRGWSRGRLDVVAWQEADLRSLGLTAEKCAAAVQFLSPQGYDSGGRAIASALRRCREPYRSAGRLLDWAPLRPGVEWAYQQVAANRHRLPGATAACRLDDDERPVGGAIGDRPREAVPPAHG